MALVRERYRFSVDDYRRLGETGILGPNERVELLAGEIVRMTPIGRFHAATVDRFTDLLVRLAAGRAIVRVQGPVQLDDFSEPEPDLALLRKRDDFYAGGHPLPADVLLLIEVADSTLAFDRDVKLPLYAASGVPEVWIVDLARGCVDAYRRPSAAGYAERRTYARGETVPIEALEAGVAVDDVLPG